MLSATCPTPLWKLPGANKGLEDSNHIMTFSYCKQSFSTLNAKNHCLIPEYVVSVALWQQIGTDSRVVGEF